MISVDTRSAYFYCSGMPERSFPITRLINVVGYLEAVSLVGYGASIALFERSGATDGMTGSSLAPVVLTALYAIFAGIAVLVTRMLASGRRAAFTPFLLMQAFAFVVAQSLLGAQSTRAAGAMLVAVGALGISAAIRMRKELS